jgi:Tfp pilus assembly protein PilO
MSALKKSGNVTILTMIVVAVLGLAFWILLLSPKREEAAELGQQVEQVEASLAQHRAEVSEGEAARNDFSADYQRLVVLGKAVPGNDETASLLVQVSGIARRAGVDFKDIALSSAAGGEEAPAAPASAGEPASATEAAASLMPLGASIGTAGLAVMPYTLTFDGSFFQITDFIKGLDALVQTQSEEVKVDGRLITVDSFSLATGEGDSSLLTATFSVTTYLTPPGEGITGGATLESPAGSDPALASATLGATP